MRITCNSKFSAHQVLWTHGLLIIVAFVCMCCWVAVMSTIQSSKPNIPTLWLFILLILDFLLSVFPDCWPCFPWGETCNLSLSSPLMSRPLDSILFYTFRALPPFHAHCPYPFLGVERWWRSDFYCYSESRVYLWLKRILFLALHVSPSVGSGALGETNPLPCSTSTFLSASPRSFMMVTTWFIIYPHNIKEEIMTAYETHSRLQNRAQRESHRIAKLRTFIWGDF